MAKRERIRRAHPVVGDRQGHWLVLGPAPAGHKRNPRVFCRCDCGNERAVYVSNWIKGRTSSCGCAKGEAILGAEGFASWAKPPVEAGSCFGRWVVVGHSHRDGKNAMWSKCRCKCGVERIVRDGSLRTGNSTSCGCTKRDAIVHGATRDSHKSAEYMAWTSMIGRCTNPRSQTYHRYGGRGITVCDRWRGSFQSFIEDMGLRPSAGHSLDRIDVNGGYEPSNCRWATRTQQMRNTRKTVVLEVEGVRRPLYDWAERLGRNPLTIYSRLRAGWNAAEAIFLPFKARPSMRHGVPI